MENMSGIDFSNIAVRYEGNSLVQRSAADVLLKLLEIGENDDVLDIGCGVGNLTKKIRGLAGRGKVVGIDPSEGMVRWAMENSKNLDICFEIKNAEDMDYIDSFSVVFCNSSFQWFKDPQKAVGNCCTALRKGGRMGIQAPAKRAYSPNFIDAIQKVKEDPRTKDTFSNFREPWFFLETSGEYKNLFERNGFKVVFSKIENIKTEYTPEEVFNVFSSGAIAGYLNQDFYDIDIGEDYVENFKEIVRDAFFQQADTEGKVELIFNRIFLVAVKE